MMRTTTLLPLDRFVTLQSVPNGCVRCAAVRLFRSKISPLAVLRHVEAVQVEGFDACLRRGRRGRQVAEPDRDLEHLKAVVLLQAADAILALTQPHDVILALSLQRRRLRRGRLGRRRRRGRFRLRWLLLISG